MLRGRGEGHKQKEKEEKLEQLLGLQIVTRTSKEEK
jgi:hypothetical protein